MIVRAIPPLLIATASAATLTVIYVLFHPYYFGDSVWYALDIKSGNSLPLDSGHLVWRPLGYFLHQSTGIPPLPSLQYLSAFFTATLVIFTFLLARKLSLSPFASLLSALLVATSNFCVSYGASGSSYAAATALSLASFYYLIPREQSKYINPGQILIAASLLVLAWCCWGLALLLLPAFALVILLFSDGSAFSRLLRSCLYSCAVILSVGCVSYLSFSLFAQNQSSFFSWFQSSSHGIPIRPGFMSIARAAIGVCSTFFYTGSFGRNIKSLLLEQEAQFDLQISITAFMVLLFWTALAWTYYRQVRGLFALDKVSLLFISTTLFVSAFALLWQGSDVERFCLALPFFAIGIVATFSSPSKVVFACLLSSAIILLNATTITLPVLSSKGPLPKQFVTASQKHCQPGDLIVLTGQRLGGSVWAPIEYFSGAKVHSILYDIQTNGVSDWDNRLDRVIASTHLRDGRVYVLTDLIAGETPGGLGLLKKEYPEPELRKIRSFFSEYKTLTSWAVNDFVFLEISH